MSWLAWLWALAPTDPSTGDTASLGVTGATASTGDTGAPPYTGGSGDLPDPTEPTDPSVTFTYTFDETGATGDTGSKGYGIGCYCDSSGFGSAGWLALVVAGVARRR